MSFNLNDDNNKVGLFLKAMVSREPGKRKVKPSKTALIDLAELDLGESSDDSDFQVDESKLNEDDDISLNSLSGDDRNTEEETDSGQEEDDNPMDDQTSFSTTDGLLRRAEEKSILHDQTVLERPKVLVCAVCLGDYSDDTNEIVICDGCHVSVHEGCYGISDTISVSSTVSSSSTEPWFCDSCRAGVANPSCELCPNLGQGIFKETETGCWVHLVCALYIPGIAFTEVDKLSLPTLFEMSFTRYGSKACNLCEDERFSRTGVCISCDAGMCRSHFHVTCAQREGLLSEVNHGEADQADPYYAHCRLHTDKELIRKRKRNWLALQMVKKFEEQNKTTEQTRTYDRLQFKLQKYKERYSLIKSERARAWLPTQKMPRAASTCSSLFRSLLQKTSLMGINTECEGANAPPLGEIRKKWHLPPAFNLEYISYFLDRKVRLQEMKVQLEEHLKNNEQLLIEEASLMTKYSKLSDEKKQSQQESKELLQKALDLHDMLKGLACRPLCLPAVVAAVHDPYINGNAHIHSQAALANSEKKVLTKAATKMMAGVTDACGGVANDEDKQFSKLGNETLTLYPCDVCQLSKEQHLLIQCDMCRNFYHLSCLDPPLTRMPKKTKQMGWQCSDCCKSSDSDKASEIDTAAPRKLRRNIKEPSKFSPSISAHQKIPSLKCEGLRESGETFKSIDQTELVSASEMSPKYSPKVTKKRGRKSIKKSVKCEIRTDNCVNPATTLENVQPLQLDPADDNVCPSSSAARGRPRKGSKVIEIPQPKDENKPATMKSSSKTSHKNTDKMTQPDSSAAEKPKKDKIASPKRRRSVESMEPQKLENHTTTKKCPVLPTEDVKLDVSEPDLICKETLSADPVLLPDIVDTSKEQITGLYAECAKTSTSSTSHTTELSADSLSSAPSECPPSDDAQSLKKDKRHRENKKKKRIREKSGDDPHKKKKKHHHKDRQLMAQMSSEILSPVRLKIKPMPPRPPGNMGSVSITSAPLARAPEFCAPHTTSTTTAPPGYPPLPPGYTLTQPMSMDAAPLELAGRNEKSTFQLPYITVASGPNLTTAIISSAKKNGVSKRKSETGAEQFSNCDVCGEMGGVTNTVTCDECLKAYHFNCLEPPLKKSPKRRGYSWFCEDCDNGPHQPDK